jgi:hypothetical protein
VIEKIKNIDLKYWLVLLGAYLFSAGASFAIFSSIPKQEVVSPINNQSESTETTVFSGPKDQACPINGELFTEGERKIWEKRRPLLVMIENHEDSRPQSGLSLADVVYEAVAEGGITRFLGVYYCRITSSDKKYNLGPVRSARTYFLDLASEYGDYPLYAHVGGAGNCNDPNVDPRAKALCQIEKYGWKDKEHWSDLDQFALPYKVCRREPERTGQTKATEHTMYCDSSALWKKAEERGLSGSYSEFQPWLFKEDLSPEERGKIGKISLYFWKGYKGYGVSWQYDKDKNIYYRFNGGKEHRDFLNQEQLYAKTVVVQFAKEIGPVDEKKHLLYKLIGKGNALVFQDGRVIKGRWSKPSRTERTVFLDQKGKQIEFNRGPIWIEVLPEGNTVDYGSE